MGTDLLTEKEITDGVFVYCTKHNYAVASTLVVASSLCTSNSSKRKWKDLSEFDREQIRPSVPSLGSFWKVQIGTFVVFPSLITNNLNLYERKGVKSG